MNVYVTEALIREIFDAGYRLGVEAGSEAASIHEWGGGYNPDTAQEAWENNVPYELIGDKNSITSPQFWENIT